MLKKKIIITRGARFEAHLCWKAIAPFPLILEKAVAPSNDSANSANTAMMNLL